MPRATRMSAGILAWVIVAGWPMSDSTPPRLSARLKSLVRVSTLSAASLPPFRITAFPDFKQTHDVQIVADGWVITEGVLTGTHKGPMGPIKATNKPVTIHFVDIFQAKDSKFVSGRTYINSLEVLVEIGVVPAPGAAPAASGSAAPAASGATPATKASK